MAERALEPELFFKVNDKISITQIGACSIFITMTDITKVLKYFVPVATVLIL